MMRTRGQEGAIISLSGALLLGAMLVCGLVSWSTIESGSSLGPRSQVSADDRIMETPPCPVPTPEWLRVAPVTSPTEAFSQTVWVTLGNGETITVTADPGIFTAPYTSHPSGVRVHLIPDHTHYLRVEARVAVTDPICNYGGYTLSTSVDINGDPLMIEQINTSVEPTIFFPIIYSS